MNQSHESQLNEAAHQISVELFSIDPSSLNENQKWIYFSAQREMRILDFKDKVSEIETLDSVAEQIAQAFPHLTSTMHRLQREKIKA